MKNYLGTAYLQDTKPHKMPHGKIYFYLPLVENFSQKAVKFEQYYSNKNSEMLLAKTDVGNEEVDLAQKNMFSWQNILSSRQIAADIEE